MKQNNKIFRITMDVIEIYIPSVMFMLLFIAFILQIISRYVFKNPLVWPYELAQLSYLWVILLGTCYAARDDSNIVFSVVYEICSPKTRKVFDLINYTFTVVILSITIPATYKFYEFFMTRHSAVFKIPLGIVYFAFAPFLFITIVRSCYRLIQCIRMPVNTNVIKAEKLEVNK